MIARASALIGALVVLLALAGRAQAVITTEFPTGDAVGSEPFVIAPGPDGNLWFTHQPSAATPQLGRITPSGDVHEFTTGITGNTFGVTAGPDGAVWFTEPTADRIGRLDPATGQVHEVTLAAGTSPEGIVTGPDGNLWFTEGTSANSQIGRLIPSTEHVDNFPVTASSGPEWITTGPDGNLWFTRGDIAGVGRVTTAGHVDEFTTGITAPSSLEGIVTGPDGNVWFAEGRNQLIGRVTPGTGQIAEFPAGTAPEGPEGLAVGSDGNLWFTDDNSNSIGRMTLSGTVTLFSAGITPAANPDMIAAGPDGSLWFTEFAHSAIGRITPERSPQATTAAADGITSRAATLHGAVNPFGMDTRWSFQFGTTPAYGSTAGPEQGAGAGTYAVPASAPLTGLLPSTLYHYRLVATNALGTTNGADMTFTTNATPACTLRAASPKVALRGKRRARLQLQVRCTQDATVVLTGALKERIRKRTKRVKLPRRTGTVHVGVALVLNEKLPKPAFRLLKKGTKESASFSVTATNVNGTATAGTKIARLRTRKR